MHKRFYLDITGVSVAIALLIPGVLMMSIGFIGFHSGPRFIAALAVGAGVLIALWCGLARGTYVTVDGENKQLRGTLGFFRARTTPLADIVSINGRKIFMGGMTEVYMKYRKKDGTLGERGLVNKESLRKSDFTNLLETIRSMNPTIEIAQELLDRNGR